MKTRFCFIVLTLVVANQPLLVRADDFSDAQSKYFSGNYERCIELCEDAIFQLPHSQEWPLLKIRSELTIGRYSDALNTLEEGLYTHPNSIRLRILGIEVLRYFGEAERADEMVIEVERLYDRNGWRYRDALNQVAIGEFLLGRDADAKLILDRFFNPAKSSQPQMVEPYLAIAELALAKNDFALAAENLQRANELQPGNPDILHGLSRAFAPTDLQLAATWVEKALAANPNHIPSLLALTGYQINAELYDAAETLIKQVLAINPQQVEAWAYRAAIAHLHNLPEKEREYREQALAKWSTNPRVDYLIGTVLSSKYRFREAAFYLHRSLAMDEEFLPAKLQLAQDLLRIGEDRKGWELVHEVQRKDAYNVVAFNLATLNDRMKVYTTLETPQFIVRMDPLEATLYGNMVLQLLKDAATKLADKYEIEIESPVTVEIFSRQQDFAIRTFGTPGGDGFLGVCFGNLITMNSPAAQRASLTSWQSVLWHEFCHVVTLQKTENKMPRWLSEGISVYEERLANSAWGQALNPRYRAMILNAEDLTPVSQLSSAFLRPKSQMHLQFAYFQSSLVVEYLIEEYGLDVVRKVLNDLRMGMPINESLARYSGSMDLLDREFAIYAKKLAETLLADTDLDPATLPEDLDLDGLQRFLDENPRNLPALLQMVWLRLGNHEWQEALQLCGNLIELGFNFPGEDNPYLIAASIHYVNGEMQEEQRALENYMTIDVDAPEQIQRLMEIAFEFEDWDRLALYTDLYLGLNPLISFGHEYSSKLALATSDDQRAIASLQAILALDPLDAADAKLKLAAAFFRQGDLVKARRAVLESIEEAPRNRDAYKLFDSIMNQSISTKRGEAGPPAR